MILIGDGRLGLDICPETPDQAEKIENMMRIVWVEEAYCRQKASGATTCSLFSSGKEAKHVILLISCYVTIELLNRDRF